MKISLTLPVTDLKPLFKHAPMVAPRFSGDEDGDTFKVSKPKSGSKAPAEKKTKLAVFAETGIKSATRRQFEELVQKLEVALETPIPVGIDRYQGDQEILLQGQKFTLSRRRVGTTWNTTPYDYAYRLTRSDGKQIIDMGYQSNYPGNYDTSPYLEVRGGHETKALRIYDTDIVSIARQLCRARFRVPSLLHEGKPVKLSKKELDNLNDNREDQKSQLQRLLKDLDKMIVVNTTKTDKGNPATANVLIDGQKYTLQQGHKSGNFTPYSLTSEDKSFVTRLYMRDNYPQNYQKTPFLSCKIKSSEGGGEHTVYGLETPDPELVGQAATIFDRAFQLPSLLDGPTERVISPAVGYDIFDALQRVASTQGEYALQFGPQFKVFAPLLIDRGNVKVPAEQEDHYAESVQGAFQKAFYAMYEKHASASNVGAAMALTAKYVLNGNLPLEQVAVFWEAALRYCNTHLKTKFTFEGEIEEDTFGDMITRNGIEQKIPLDNPDPLSRLYELMGEKEVRVGNLNVHPTNPLFPVVQATDPESLHKALEIHREVFDALASGASQLSASSGSLSEVVREMGEETQTFGANYLRAYMGDELATLKVAYRLLYDKNGLELFAPIAQRRESMMDRLAAEARGSGLSHINPLQRRYQHEPNLAEFFLSLNSPQIGKQHSLADLITRAITSVEQHIAHGISIKGAMVRQWGRIGLLTHGFKPYKHDARGGKESLFSRFGFERIPRKSEQLGPGFLLTRNANPAVLKSLDPDTLIEFRRGYYLASNPKWGAVLVRNSSLVFGRDLLMEPAYYSPTALSQKELKTLDSEADLTQLGFTRILDPALYTDTHVRRFTTHLEALLNEIFNVREAYSKWRFDPADFDQDDNFRGDLKPGLKAVADYLENRLGELALGMDEQPVPALAIYSPHLPPEHPYLFYDNQGEAHRVLPVTESVIAEIQDRLNGAWNDAKYPNSVWTSFIQEAVNHQAEILMVDPPNPLQEKD